MKSRNKEKGKNKIGQEKTVGKDKGSEEQQEGKERKEERSLVLKNTVLGFLHGAEGCSVSMSCFLTYSRKVIKK